MILAGALVVLIMAGCGGSSEAETTATPIEAPPLPAEIKVTLDGHMGAENVGLLMAEQRGYFDDVGLKVFLAAPAAPRNSAYYVATRIDEFGVSHMPQVAIARENGLPIVAVGSVIPQPTAALIWLEGSKIRDVADLRGKTIGVPGVPFQEDLLEIVLGRAGLTLDDVGVLPVSYRMVPALVKGQVDAIFGGSANVEGAALRSQGAEPVIERVQDLGVPLYEELVVIAREDRAVADPEAIRAFMAAVRRGTAAAVEDPEAAARAIESSREPTPGATRKEIEAQVEATLPLLSRTGRIDRDRTADFLEWMHQQGLTRRAMPVSELVAGGPAPSPGEHEG